MSVKFLYSSEKTNSYRPVPWHYSTDKFPALRGNGWKHHGFLAVGKDYKPHFVGAAASSEGYTGFSNPTYFDASATKLTKVGQKQTLMLVPCSDEQDEQIMLITLRGGFRGGYGRIESVGCEVLMENTSGGHCVVTGHMIVRLTDPRGYVFAETGRRSSSGLVEVFSWEGYKTMKTDEFEAWHSCYAPDLTDGEAIAAGKTKAEAARKAALAGAKAKAEAHVEAVVAANAVKPVLMPLLEALNGRLDVLNYQGITLKETKFRYGWSDYDYSMENVSKVEALVAALEVEVAEKKAAEAKAKAEAEAARRQLEVVAGRFYALGYELCINDDGYLWGGYRNHFTAENASKMLRELEEIESKAAARAELEAKRNAAAALGLPQDVQIWRRRGGRTNAGDGWVVQPNGMPREPDKMQCPRPRYQTEGTQVWHQVYAGELVLRWAKSCSAAPHEFEVVYQPAELTAEQLRTVALLQEELSEEWDGALGASSGQQSPPVGDGWGILYSTHASDEVEDIPVVTPVESGKPASAEGLAALAARFRK